MKLISNAPIKSTASTSNSVKPAWPRLGLLNLEELVSIDRFGDHPITGEVEA